MARIPTYSGQFKRDLKKIKKQGKDITKLKVALELLLEEKLLPSWMHDHPRKSN